MTEATDLIQTAAAAWRDLKAAEGHIARIDQYPRKNEAMKADMTRHKHAAAAARATLDNILKVTP
jgi:hypothetical protein